jgi:hypothetical protein
MLYPHRVTLKRKRWSELTNAQRAGVIIMGSIQLLLLVAALWDIRQRPVAEINGSKKLWTAVVFINWIGPLAYFLFGRSKPKQKEAGDLLDIQ